ncbi:WD repeat and SOCS box-containing protein 2 [Hypomesus transpacificus]|uniref:WD repeat and SOCS box-containing protein 2 n=1 Tax=Hypomesus transpacificus TaxID=137520 RepID=UPI001F081EAD|nr:WD repeat and SOCS box-containing protein 2 [Hypomesus transpacificus]
MCSSEEKIEQRPTSPEELLMELRSAHAPSLNGRAGCETWSVDFSPDGEWFAWSMGHGIVWLVAWPIDAGKKGQDRPDKKITCGQTVWGLAFGPRPPRAASSKANAVPNERPSSLLLATGLDNGVIMIWSVATGRHLYDLKGHDGIARELVFPPNGKLTLISSSRDKTLRIWDLNHKGKKAHVLSGHKDWISSCCVSPDCSMIASVGRFDRMVCLWSLRSYTFIRTLSVFFKTFFLLVSCDFSPDGALLATAAFGGASWWIDLWDPYTGEKLASLVDDCIHGQNQISALQFSPDGLHLAVVTDRAVCVWELGQEDMLLNTKGQHATNGLCCSFHPQGGVVAMGTRDGHVRFWKVPLKVPSLVHLCRSALRLSISTQQVQALPIPRRILDYLTYRNIPNVFNEPIWDS